MMKAMVTEGIGGYDKLVYKDVPIPVINDFEVLVKVLSCGLNNTEINTRMGWYSKTIESSTNELSNVGTTVTEKGGWQGTTPFPMIQGTDCCGIVVKTGAKVDKDSILNRRVLIRPCQRSKGFDSYDSVWMASDFNGAFAQFVKVTATEVFPIECTWTDVELGSIPCAYGTSENMIHRSKVTKGNNVLIIGASGGVGSASVQLCARRGAHVYAITTKDKAEQLVKLGCTQVFSREDDIIGTLGEKFMDVVIDNVGGASFPKWLKILKVGGKYATSGAISGPLVQLDMRDLYLKDITLIGCTCWDEPVFPNLIKYIENGEIKPLISASYPLSEMAVAQEEFLKKKHLGKIVFIPPISIEEVW